MKFKRDLVWWYWAATAVLVLGAAVGCEHSLIAAIGLTVIQAAHFGLRTRRISFPVQTRLAFLGMLLISTLPHMHFLQWMLVAGLTANVVFRYCGLARTISLMSWNRAEPLSLDLLRRTYLSKPQYGVIAHGLGDMFFTPYPYVNLARRAREIARPGFGATTLIPKDRVATHNVAA